MQKPTIEATEALLQAGMTMETYLATAKRSIDKYFGQGHAHSNPELVAACVHVQAADFNNTSWMSVMYEIDASLSNIGDALDIIADAQSQTETSEVIVGQ